jgi:hypothetical protein
MRLISLLLLALSCLVRPHAARCPAGRDLRTGIRRDGRFECWSAPRGSVVYDGTFGHPDRSVQRDDAVEARIVCTGGSVPIVVDAVTVGCQMRH